jgi:hypothetical protein
VPAEPGRRLPGMLRLPSPAITTATASLATPATVPTRSAAVAAAAIAAGMPPLLGVRCQHRDEVRYYG